MSALGSVLHCGAYVPRLRLARAVITDAVSWLSPPARALMSGTRAIGNWDEDALTMAVEAARCCVAPAESVAGPVSTVVQAVMFCSTTAPFADRDNAVILTAALDLPAAIETSNFAGSLRAGTCGLISAAHRTDTHSLVVASDARLTRAGSSQELLFGDAAAAMLIGPASAGSLATILATHSLASDFVDHYRMSGARFDYALEDRWVRDESLMKLVPEAVAQLLADSGCQAGAIRHLAMPGTAATVKRIASACGLTAAHSDESVLRECGDAGAALPLLLLAAALDKAQPGELIVLIGIGQGVDAVLLRAADGVRKCGQVVARALARQREEPSYVRYLAHRGLLEVDFGMRAERDQRTAHSVAYRRRGAIMAFKGGRCERCGTVQFPQSRVCVHPQCRATDTQVPHRLADYLGRVKSFTEDWQAYSARPPYLYGNVEFAAGGNLLMEFTDSESGEVQIDAMVRFVFRIKDEDRLRGFRRYFWKATQA